MLAVLFGVLGWSRAREGTATNATMAGIGTVFGGCAVALGIWGMAIAATAVDQSERICRASAVNSRRSAGLYRAQPHLPQRPSSIAITVDFAINVKLLNVP